MPGLLCDGKVQRDSFIAGKGVGPFPPLPLEKASATQWAPTQWTHQGKRWGLKLLESAAGQAQHGGDCSKSQHGSL